MRYEVILDSGETANKCTIAPLADRPDFRLIGVRNPLAIAPLRADLLLHYDGACLSRLRESFGRSATVSAIDCIWRRVPELLRGIQGKLPTLARIPDGFVTTYPRRAETGTDPDAGLATIEAIFVAAALLGNWDESLLSRYRFGREFVERNAETFLRLGVREVGDPARWPVLARKPRSARQRKEDRKHGFPEGVEF